MKRYGLLSFSLLMLLAGAFYAAAPVTFTTTTPTTVAMAPSVPAFAPSSNLLSFAIFGAGDNANSNSTSIGKNVEVSGLVGGNRSVQIRAGSNVVGLRS